MNQWELMPCTKKKLKYKIKNVLFSQRGKGQELEYHLGMSCFILYITSVTKKIFLLVLVNNSNKTQNTPLITHLGEYEPNVPCYCETC